MRRVLAVFAVSLMVNGSTWTTSKTLRTNGQGHVAKRLSFTKKGTIFWRWVSPANASYHAAKSTRTKVVVR